MTTRQVTALMASALTYTTKDTYNVTLSIRLIQYTNKKLRCRKQTVRVLYGSFFAEYNRKTIFCGHYGSSVFNHCNVIGLQSCRIRRKNAKKAITPFKVIQDYRCRYQSKTHMRFPIRLILTGILSRTVSKLSNIIV